MTWSQFDVLLFLDMQRVVSTIAVTEQQKSAVSVVVVVVQVFVTSFKSAFEVMIIAAVAAATATATLLSAPPVPNCLAASTNNSHFRSL